MKGLSVVLVYRLLEYSSQMLTLYLVFPGWYWGICVSLVPSPRGSESSRTRLLIIRGQSLNKGSATRSRVCNSYSAVLANTRYWPNTGLMLVHRLQRWPNSNRISTSLSLLHVQTLLYEHTVLFLILIIVKSFSFFNSSLSSTFRRLKNLFKIRAHIVINQGHKNEPLMIQTNIFNNKLPNKLSLALLYFFFENYVN